ncbi:MAG: amidohydrolase family protein [Spirochaetia bacterium]|nr:amidohydrolase family protein [Spirochaetia bacterium]
MGKILKGQWGLSPDGVIKSDPWYLLQNNRIIQSGFGKCPDGYRIGKIGEGLILPGLVNAHTHLELSVFKGKTIGGHGVHNFALSFMDLPEPEFEHRIYLAALELKKAVSRGTFYFADIANTPAFSKALESNSDFQGLRFLELLGFSDPADAKRISMAREALLYDKEIIFAPHSVYGSSPEIFKYIASKGHRITSLHALEAQNEINLFHETGSTCDFLTQIRQYKRHAEVYKNSFVSYLEMMMKKFKKIFLVHMTYADENIIKDIAARIPQAAVVLCFRSNEFLSCHRNNWESIEKNWLPLLLGTDSAASCPDVSILDEVLSVIHADHLPQSLVWKAATSNAYNYLELPVETIPCFWYEGATSNPLSLTGKTGIPLSNLPAIGK